MQQPYVTSVPYGASLTTGVSSGYGTINPGPSGGANGVKNSTAIGEYLGNSADESATAQYTPITHAVRLTVDSVRFFNKKPLFEGDLVFINSAGNDRGAGSTAGITPAFKGRQKDFDYGEGEVGGEPERFCVRPLAADLLVEVDGKNRGRKRAGTYATIAWAGTATVKMDPTQKEEYAEHWAPGQNVFVNVYDPDDGLAYQPWFVKLACARDQEADNSMLLGRLTVAKRPNDSQLLVCLAP